MATLINAGAVILGSVTGLLIHKKLPDRIAAIVFQGIGSFTLFLGITMASKTGSFLVMIFSIVTGFVTSFLLFRMGSMTILGAIEEDLCCPAR